MRRSPLDVRDSIIFDTVIGSMSVTIYVDFKQKSFEVTGTVKPL